MDKRTRDRIHEHTIDGHILYMPDENYKVERMPEMSLCRCVCGWFGWLRL